MKQNPIGIFDSGMGGLTNTAAIHELLPHESLIYVADLQHLPYGGKSTAQIQAYCLAITDYLLHQDCKMIVVACHTASSAAAELIRQHVANRVPVIDVISPIVNYVSQHYAGKKVGLIGTQYTVDSQIYSRRLKELGNHIELHAIATPLLASFIESQYDHEMDCHALLQKYLSQPDMQQLDALILACTHYSLIKPQIRDYYQQRVQVIDSRKLVAQLVKQTLTEKSLLNDGVNPTQHFFTTQESPQFATVVEKFFAIKAEHLNL